MNTETTTPAPAPTATLKSGPQSATPAAAKSGASGSAGVGAAETDLHSKLASTWLKQSTLVLAFSAAIIAFSVARWADRSWLMAVFCAWVAMVATAVIGSALVKMLMEHVAAALNEAPTPEPARQGALTK